jgi:hypothetical protein
MNARATLIQPRSASLLATGLALAAAGLLAPASASASASLLQGADAQDPTCQHVERMALEGRASPLESARVELADGVVLVCYGSPRLRDRTMIGGSAVPFGSLWRFGANEATVLHTTVPLSVGGVEVPAGSVSLYAIPGETTWEIFLSESTDHWGLQITEAVRARELGSFEAQVHALDAPVEEMTLRFEEAGTRGAVLVFEWQDVRFEIPVVASGA